MAKIARDADQVQRDYDAVKFVIDTHRKEIQRHEERYERVFNYTLTIMLALSAGYIGFAQSESWSQLQPLLRTLFPITFAGFCILITWLATKNMHYSVISRNINRQVVIRASLVLKLFDDDAFGEHEPFYFENWKDWGKQEGIDDSPSYNNYVLYALAAVLTLMALLL